MSLLKNENNVFDIHSAEEFEAHSLRLFQQQYRQNEVYKKWVDVLGIKPVNVLNTAQIPFLPIEFFKTRQVLSTPIHPATLEFTSSSTTSQVPARHYVNSITLYETSFLKGFKLFYGQPEDYCILALLPSYLSRSGSSLVYMCDRLIRESGHRWSGFFLNEWDLLGDKIQALKKTNQKVLLIGVSYALMDLSEMGIELNSNFTVMETGGMKGTRKELLKPELHALLKKGFGVDIIHSEYGMTELLSQAYSTGDGRFRTPPWLKFFTREIADPLQIRNDERTGGINVIDLANSESCCFIATKDLGRIHTDGSLELMGRYNNSDVRGCNLLLDGISRIGDPPAET